MARILVPASVCILPAFIPARACCLELTLKQVINLALKNNPGLKAEKVELDRRQSEVTEKETEYIPVLSLTPSYGWQKDQPGTPGMTQNNQDYKAALNQKLPLGRELSLSYGYGRKSLSAYQSEITSYRLGPGLSIEPYTEMTTIDSKEKYYPELELSYTQHLLKDGLLGPTFVLIKRARFDPLVQKENLSGFQIDLINKVKASFYENIVWQENIKFAQELLEISRRILDLVTSRYEIGLSAEIDVITAKIETNRTRQEVLSPLRALEGARKKLKDLLGINCKIRVRNQLEVERPPIEVDRVVSEALKHNKGLLATKREIEKQQLAVKVAFNHLLPRVDLFASLKQTGWGSSFDDARNLQSREYRIGLVLSYPLYNKGLKEGYWQEEGELEKLRLRYRELEIGIKNSAAMLVRQLNLLEGRINILIKQLNVLEKRLKLTLQAFDEGLINIDRVYDTRDDLVEGRKARLVALLEYHQQWALLDKLMGKGI